MDARAGAAAIDCGRGVELYRAGDRPRQIEEGLSGVGRCRRHEQVGPRGLICSKVDT